ncbi:MAG: sigma 54-interacting transcriptional regulator, partial [Deltaproteobacteria bacterium]|nr:sigma 54-interacting transcriptional regulator [Deltaproteobacteria bacterium]
MRQYQLIPRHDAGNEQGSKRRTGMPYIDFSNIHGHRQVLNLTGGHVTIGRDPACDISFPDRSISRIHSRFYCDNHRWFIEDLDSTNGTLVNQQPVQSQALSEGDIIQVGPFILVFRTSGEKEPSIVLNRDEMTRVISEVQINEYHKVAELHQRWEILLQIAEALDALGTTQELLDHFMAALQKIFSPLTCIIALGDEYLRKPEPVGDAAASDTLEASTARVMARVREKKQGVIFDADAASGQLFAEKVGPQMCAPIMAGGQMRGVIYMNRTPHSGGFCEDDLRTLLIFTRLIITAAASSEKLARLDAENRIMSASIGKVGIIVGKSKKTRDLIDLIETKVGPVDTTVLFTGETGTGKTWAAQALHLASPRAKGPFIKVNCAAIPENLLESELFGHEKGAFSGATSRKSGLFEAANGGTLFLDEIGELNLSSQAKLLTVLQDKQLQRL